jgi:hypothetical protein
MTPLFKTITLELLQNRLPSFTMQTLDHYSSVLRDAYTRWTETLQRPETTQAQLSSEATELAIQDLKNLLESDFPTEPNPDEATAFIPKA